MYVPKTFAQHDTATLHGFIAHTPLAIVVTNGEQGLLASHLPLLLVQDEGEHGTLYGHFARANPQWRILQAGEEALVVFQGAEAYVSPSFYPAKAEHGKVVPTWNYQAVHAYGRAEVFDDRERLLALVSTLSDRHERNRERPWAVSDAPAAYIDSMLRAIVGFALPISRLEGQFKLSQNKDAANFRGVQQGLQQSERPSEQQIAQAMAALQADA
ncbi:FMN-binding negative transcriptional regulator [Pseudomonas sp. PDM14]|uniref:FMN-binding negative transcriptional regulator n=1 Tax=Pseudomonas sp. PDM14 TaxID=2769288 RepID=UPI0017827D6F|nr:FMN-binding negative transcriptional regulator [Pseudomonas sp. PDM14]MBD9483254.1 FMN-binding negative transcriptional regulator [Pseudomonas sp. PDM14]